MRVFCERHNARALAVFGNTVALQHLAVRLLNALHAEPGYQAVLAQACQDEPPAAERDRRAQARIKTRMEVGLVTAGIYPICCYLPDAWSRIVSELQAEQAADADEA